MSTAPKKRGKLFKWLFSSQNHAQPGTRPVISKPMLDVSPDAIGTDSKIADCHPLPTELPFQVKQSEGPKPLPPTPDMSPSTSNHSRAASNSSATSVDSEKHAASVPLSKSTSSGLKPSTAYLHLASASSQAIDEEGNDQEGNDQEGNDQQAVDPVPQAVIAPISPPVSPPLEPTVVTEPPVGADTTVTEESEKKRSADADVALRIFHGKANFIDHVDAASWLGDSGSRRSRIRTEYMKLFDWTNQSVLAALRNLCDKLYMKAESQQLDRIIDSFSDRWCECNPHHGFKSPGIVYTLAYSMLLLNTDHHSEEYTSSRKMMRPQYVQQTFETMKSLLKGDDADTLSLSSKRKLPPGSVARNPSLSMKRWSSTMGSKVDNTTLVCDPTQYTNREWGQMIVSLLKGIYTSIDLTPLNLAETSDNLVAPRIVLHAQSSAGSLKRSHGFNGAADNYGPNSLVSRLGLNRKSSWLTSNDTWSDYDYQSAVSRNGRLSNKTSSMYINVDEPIGFSGVLRNAILRQEHAAEREKALGNSEIASAFEQSIRSYESDAASEIQRFQQPARSDASAHTYDTDSQDIEVNREEEERLELRGAPWAKEGLLQLQYADYGIVKKYRRRDAWVKVFVIVQKGYLKIFRFDGPRPQRKGHGSFDQPSIGGGNWLDRATLTDNISLCQAMAQLNPISRKQNAATVNSTFISSAAYMSNLEPDEVEWSLTLPSRSVLIFRAGTVQVAEEYVYASNYWAARISKEPLVEPVSSCEYGWSRPLELVAEKKRENAEGIISVSSSSQDSITIDKQRIVIGDWYAPLSSAVPSKLSEEAQLHALKAINENAQLALERHNKTIQQMIQLFQSNLLVSARAHSNWEKKSQHLLKETIKYDIYINTLERGMVDRASANVI